MTRFEGLSARHGRFRTLRGRSGTLGVRFGTLRAAGAIGLVGILATGCGITGGAGVNAVPLPGGADLGAHPITIRVEFTNVLDLVPQAGVRVANVPVGRVSSISLGGDGHFAVVTLEINGDVKLPANAIGSIQQTSLLGEKYVTLAPPTQTPPTGSLGNGARIQLSATSSGVELEQVFGALSLLLNGGGLEQLQTITTELNKAQSGRTDDFKNLLSNLEQVVGQLDQRRDSITKALDAVNVLAANLRANTAQIQSVLDNLSPGLQVLADERTQLVTMLDSLNRLSAVTVTTLDASKNDIVGDLQNLAPVLNQLAASGAALPAALQVLLTYPFPDSAVKAIKGDYLNVFISANFRTQSSVATPAAWPNTSSTIGGSGVSPIAPPPSLLPSTSSVSPGLPESTITSTPTGTSSAPQSPSSNSPTSKAPTTKAPTSSAPTSKAPAKSPSPNPTSPGSASASPVRPSPTGPGK